MTAPTPEVLAADPAFAALTGIAVRLAEGQIGLVAGLDEDAFAARSRQIRQLTERLRTLRKQPGGEVPDRVFAVAADLFGMTRAELEALTETARGHVAALLKAHPEFETAEARDLVASCRGAVERLGAEAELARAIAAARPEIDPSIACSNLCHAIAAVLAMLLGVVFLLAVAKCSALIIVPPLFALCMLLAVAALAKDLDWLMRTFLQDCLDACDDVVEG